MSYIGHAPPWAKIDPDLEKLFHPASAFDHPQDMVRDPDLSTEEKRAIPVVLGIRRVCCRIAARHAAAAGRGAAGRL